jgi:hypothetical protein
VLTADWTRSPTPCDSIPRGETNPEGCKPFTRRLKRFTSIDQPHDAGESNDMKTSFLSLLILCVLTNGALAAEPITLKLWPDGPPTAMMPKSEATI